MWIIKSLLLAILKLLLFVIGIVILPIGLLFREEFPETQKPFTKYPPGNWMMVRVPTWMKWWDNLSDGALGDKRGWWDNWTKDNYGKPCTAFYSMYMWLAFRNPVNYFSRCVAGIDVSTCKISKVFGDDVVTEDPGTKQYQLLEAVDSNNTKYKRFFLCRAYNSNPTKALLVDIGWKIKLEHNKVTSDSPDSEKFKGIVFTISPWKTLT